MLSLFAQAASATSAALSSEPNNEQNQLLQQLRDVHQPEAVSWWPLALGWWVIIALVVIIIALLIRAVLKKRHYRFVRFAVKELQQLKADTDDPRWLAKSHNIMRRLSLCYVSEDDIGRMNQQQWLAFLQATNNQKLGAETLEALTDLPYKPESHAEKLNKPALLSDIISWAEQFPEQAKSWHKHQQSNPGEAHV